MEGGLSSLCHDLLNSMIGCHTTATSHWGITFGANARASPWDFLAAQFGAIFICYHTNLKNFKFILRLAKLGRADLLAKFQYPFRYIDDLCLLNVQNPRAFLSVEQPRVDDNPWWIYPLDILDIKEEIEKFSLTDPEKGIAAHFLNVNIQLNESCPLKFSLQKYDKRRSLPFKYTQYIKFSSNRAIQQAYNVVVSQVLPILYVFNSEAVALQEIQILISTMCANGFLKPRLINIICRFITKSHFRGLKIDLQLIASAITN